MVKKRKVISKINNLNQKRILGFSLIVIAIVTIISNVSVTGAVIGTSISNSLNLIAVVLFIIGIILTTSKDRNYAQEILDQRRYVDDTSELKRIARQMGYTLEEGYNEGTRVYKGKTVLTVIPHHRRIQGRGTVKGILEALASGESSFRRRPAA